MEYGILTRTPSIIIIIYMFLFLNVVGARKVLGEIGRWVRAFRIKPIGIRCCHFFHIHFFYFM